MMKRTKAANITEYIATCPAELRPRLEQLRAAISKAAPRAQERISYQIPTFSLCGNLVHFAAYDRHVGFYPGASGVEHFQKDLASYATSKGAVQFPHDRAIPFGLIGKIVKFRIAENVEKAAARDVKKKKKKNTAAKGKSR